MPDSGKTINMNEEPENVKMRHETVKLLYANVRGMRSKLPCIQDVLSDAKPTIAVFTETHLNDNRGIKMEGYTFFGKAREGKPGGGVGILVKDNLKSAISPHHTQKELEIMWVSLNRVNKPPVFFGVY